MRTVLQVPMSIDLRKEAEKKALEQGFSSLQDAVRMFLKKLAQGAMGVVLREKEFITDSIYATLTTRKKPTRNQDFNRLIDLDLIERVGKGRATIYRLK